MESSSRRADHSNGTSRRRLPRFAPGVHRCEPWTEQTNWWMPDSADVPRRPARHRANPGNAGRRRVTAIAALMTIGSGPFTEILALPVLDDQAILLNGQVADSPVDAGVTKAVESSVLPNGTVNGAAA